MESSRGRSHLAMPQHPCRYVASAASLQIAPANSEQLRDASFSRLREGARYNLGEPIEDEAHDQTNEWYAWLTLVSYTVGVSLD